MQCMNHMHESCNVARKLINECGCTCRIGVRPFVKFRLLADTKGPYFGFGQTKVLLPVYTGLRLFSVNF